MKRLKVHFPKLSTFFKSIEPLPINHNPNITHNEHVYAICFRQEVADYVISSENVKILECNIVLNFEVTSSSSFTDI